MPHFLLSVISKAGRAALPIIKSGVAKGLSGNKIAGILKGQGFKIRRQSLLDIIRAERGIKTAGAALKFLGMNRFPNPLRLPPALTRIRRKYSFIVKVTTSLLATGETIEQNITISTSKLLTRGELQQRAENMITDNQERYGLEVIVSQLIEGIRAGDSGTL